MKRKIVFYVDWLTDDGLAQLAADLESKIAKTEPDTWAFFKLEEAYETIWGAGVARMSKEEFSRLMNSKTEYGRFYGAHED